MPAYPAQFCDVGYGGYGNTVLTRHFCASPVIINTPVPVPGRSENRIEKPLK
jgi:hypothetical protein